MLDLIFVFDNTITHHVYYPFSKTPEASANFKQYL